MFANFSQDMATVDPLDFEKSVFQNFGFESEDKDNFNGQVFEDPKASWGQMNMDTL